MGVLVGAGGRVLAFEPLSASADRLVASLLINGFAERTAVHRLPLAAEDGREVQIVTSRNFAAGTQVVAAGPAGQEAFSVVTRRLDGMPGALDATLVKIDTEGMEYAIWQGMTAMIAGPVLRDIVIEFSRLSYPDAGGFLDEVVAAGFRLMWLDDRRGVVPATRESILTGGVLEMLLFER